MCVCVKKRLNEYVYTLTREDENYNIKYISNIETLYIHGKNINTTEPWLSGDDVRNLMYGISNFKRRLL